MQTCPYCDSILIIEENELINVEAFEQWFFCKNCEKEFVVRYAFDYVMDVDIEQRALSWEGLQQSEATT